MKIEKMVNKIKKSIEVKTKQKEVLSKEIVKLSATLKALENVSGIKLSRTPRKKKEVPTKTIIGTPSNVDLNEVGR